jgi:NRAMP (natural resistance-associated macrophage protein)-like metal ion transporter
MGRIVTRLRKLFNRLGPGFITGAADDDPSGVATYSIAGAQYGYKLNWLSLFLIPLMISIQEMCGRIGMCSGMGLAGVIKKYYSRNLLVFSIILLMVANTINIAADLGVMAASLEMIAGVNFFFWLAVITAISIILEIIVPYRIYSVYLRFMGLSLLVYAVTAIAVKQNWLEVAKYTFIPHIDFTLPYFMTLVGFIGTTISPYLFFWQASEEVEQEITEGEIRDFRAKPHIGKKDIVRMRGDTDLGMVFSNFITMCIVLTTAATLHVNGITDISSPHQAALALKPIAGNFAFLLFTLGIIGIGLQSVPVFAGGIAYAFSEAFGFREGLGKTFGKAKAFYVIIGIATVIGALINITGVNPIRALYYAAVINGVISVPLIFIIIKMADDKRVVGSYITPKWHRVFGWITFIFVGLASVALILGLAGVGG